MNTWMDTREKVFAYIREHHMLQAGDRVVAGVSGGADSVCLLFLLLEWQKEVPTDIAVVHVDHGIRTEAGEDARYVEQLCDSEQTAALGYCLLYAQKHLLDSKRTLRQVVEALEELMDQKGLAALCEGRPGAAFLARPRRQEIFACFDRYRGLKLSCWPSGGS